MTHYAWLRNVCLLVVCFLLLLLLFFLPYINPSVHSKALLNRLIAISLLIKTIKRRFFHPILSAQM